MVHCLEARMLLELFVWHVCFMDIIANQIIRSFLQGAFVLGAVLITTVLTVPGFHNLFKVETLNLMQLGCVYLYAFASLLIIQLLKCIRMKLRKRGER